MNPTVIIEYCLKCGWLLRAAYMAQEILTMFAGEIGAVTLKPSELGDRFSIFVDATVVFDRKSNGGFAATKEIKQLIRDIIAPARSLGQSDR